MGIKEIDLDPVYTETLTPRRFLEVFERESADIKRINILPPTLGKSGFGKIVIRRKTPIYIYKHDKSDHSSSDE